MIKDQGSGQGSRVKDQGSKVKVGVQDKTCFFFPSSLFFSLSGRIGARHDVGANLGLLSRVLSVRMRLRV